MTDFELLQKYGRQRSEDAFAILVSRYSDLVYSIAARRVENQQLAEEIAQAVFLILARKAASIPEQAILSGWLFRTTRFVTNNALKREARRTKREEFATAAMHNQAESDVDRWQEVAPELDNCLEELSEADRSVVLLRYFERKSLAEVGAALAVSEDAARKRVGRALEELRQLLGKKGVLLPGGALSPLLYSRAVEAAPVSLAPLISTALAKAGAVSLGAVGAVKGVITTMVWTKAQVAIVGAGLIGLAFTIGNIGFKAWQPLRHTALAQTAQADQNPNILKSANSLIALNQQPQPDKEVRDRLRQLREENAALKAKLEQAYGRLIGELAESRLSLADRVQLLIKALQDESPQIRRAAAFALMENGRHSEAGAAAPELIKALEDPDADVRILAIRALSQIGPAGTNAIPLLRQSVTDPATAFDSALALWNISHDPEIPIQVLLPAALSDKGGHAIRALGEMGPAAEAAIPTLQQAMNSDDNNRKYDSIEALWRIDNSLTPQLVDPLVNMLTNSQTHPVHLRYAATLLGKMGAQASGAVPALTGLLSYSDEKVKGAAVAALQEIALASPIEDH